MKKRILAEYFLVIAGSFIVTAVFHLSLPGSIVLCIVGGGLIPFLERERLRGIREERAYREVTLYMEQLLCSYKRWRQLGSAWEDCMLLFEEHSEMRKAIGKALYCLKNGDGEPEKHIAWTACRCIHEKYHSSRLMLLHEFLCRTEQMGGEEGDSFDILLQDLQLWRRRNALFQTQKKVLKMQSAVSVLLAGLLCGSCRIIMPFDLENQLISSGWYQISTVVVMCLLLILFVLIFRKLTGEWLDGNSELPKEKWEKYYRILKSSPHCIKWQIARKYCRQEVEQKFPYWLLTVTLYLQQESVYQALCSSLKQFQGMFQAELKELIRGIYENPASLLPYMAFFKELEMEEIQTGMKLLYATGNSEYRDVRRQIHFLIEQNRLVMDKFEQNHQENQTAGMTALKQIPLVCAAGKGIVDMFILLVMTMQQYSLW